ncbi:YcbK family protein [Desulfotalea psychrophila]|nr:DUF882 domain-containing protein [Desulfotalea psychrophila]
MNRRRLLLTAAKIAAGLVIASPLELFARSIPDNKISFSHTHTGECFDLCVNDRAYSPVVRENLFFFLRDFRTKEVHSIDFRLMDILLKIRQKTGSTGIYQVISGYRSPNTNNLLRGKSTGVAKKSLHLQGRAIDIRLTDVPTKELRDVALSLRAGGVGYYAKSDFVHIDTGHVRSW